VLYELDSWYGSDTTNELNNLKVEINKVPSNRDVAIVVSVIT